MGGKQEKKQRRELRAEQATPEALDLAMLSDDVSLVTSLVLSLGETPWAEAAGLALAPQFARILYEGHDYIRRSRAGDVVAGSDGWARDIAVARHTVKLLDDNKKTLDSVEDEFRGIGRRHTSAFGDDNDYAVYETDGHAVATARLTVYQSLARLEGDSNDPSINYAYEFSRNMGAGVIKLQALAGRPKVAFHSLPLPASGRPQMLRTSQRSLLDRSYDQALPEGAEDVALFVECQVNAALLVFAPAERVLRGSLFRVRFVTASHAVSALSQLLAKYPPSANSSAQRLVESVVASQNACVVRDLRKLRNRCMHYGVPSLYTDLHVHKPGYGLVEAVTGGEYAFAEMETMTVDLLTEVSDALRAWRRD
jgi:hypothetical protein